jgi:hypothetical protein
VTPEQKYDRLERIARLMYEDALRASRKSRKENAALKRYVEAQREYEVAKLTAFAKPDDLGATEALHRALENLDPTREELKH